MPRTPILPTVDWKTVFDSGVTFAQWIEQGEHPDYRASIRQTLDALDLEPATAEAIRAIDAPVHVVAIAEDWCGDVVRHVPALEAIARENNHVATRYIARAQHPEMFVRFLTNGGEAIPKFIFLSKDFVECGNWGPMQSDCREAIARGKGKGDVGAARQEVSAIYRSDPGLRVPLSELAHLARIAAGV